LRKKVSSRDFTTAKHLAALRFERETQGCQLSVNPYFAPRRM